MFKQKKIFLLMLILVLVMAGCGKKTGTVVGDSQSQTNSQAESQEEAKESTSQENAQPEAEKEPESQPIEVPQITYSDPVKIELSDSSVLVDGQPAGKSKDANVYVANDIVFYLEGQGFTYGEGSAEDEHSQAEADVHTVVHITKPGAYEISGKLSKGQVAIDLGKEAEEDPEAVVILVLNGVDITCEVAPAVIFYNVYECNVFDETNATYDVDTTAAGANVVIADGSENNINGSHVARIYKSYTLNEAGTEVIDNKKLHKYDGAFYSKMSMNIFGGSKGDGVLNILADNEGLDSEMHLTLNGGIINIESGNDGINTNEDGISVTTLNAGELHIKVTGSTGEGDGIDSNGWLVINGGTLTSAGCSKSMDAGIDSDMGIYINGGNIMATGNMLDRIEGGSATYVVFTFAESQKAGNVYTMKDESGKAVGSWTARNNFTYLIVAGKEIKAGNYTMWMGNKKLVASQGQSFGGPGGMGGGQFPGGKERPEGGQFPDGMERPEGGQFPDGMERPEGGQFPDGMERPEGGQFPGGKERPEGGQFPDGMERPESGQFPEGMEWPEGMEMPEGGQFPDGFGGRGDRENEKGGQTAEMSETFTIVAGANYFSNVQVK
ncbi:MAG: carbohydrate-binding domain-containing protein [Lachnospiraceae bacterium]|nr:carbohydrate-binding domain-containing protein [Lachnospiraceae bacterium]